SPTATSVSTPCWSQPWLDRLAGVMIATLSTASRAVTPVPAITTIGTRIPRQAKTLNARLNHMRASSLLYSGVRLPPRHGVPVITPLVLPDDTRGPDWPVGVPCVP